MCGIFCSFSRSSSPGNPQDVFRDVLHRRGPDSAGSCTCRGIFFEAHVLWHQGADLSSQPFENEHGILVFNGDLFMDELTGSTGSDSSWFFETLTSCSTLQDKIDLLRRLSGPFCFIYYDKRAETLFFCRDALGRNSLLLGLNAESLILTSTGRRSSGFTLVEVPPLGLYAIHRKEMKLRVTFWEERMSLSGYFQKEETSLKAFLESFGIEYESTGGFINPPWLVLSSSGFTYSFSEIYSEVSQETPEDLLQQALSIVPDVVERLIKLLEKSVEDRVIATLDKCRNCLEKFETLPCSHARIGILFSGGIDCTILAILADKFIPAGTGIDLLNVAFERAAQRNGEVDWNVPDRKSAKEALEELRRICPNRQWNLTEVNVTKEEKTECLKDKISHLIHPRSTILDESLGVALWFAARGATACRVLLIGSGADELFGGYTRHRLAFERGGEEALQRELDEDWARLPSRNLARDDRVICDHGVTQRSPFIEEQIVQFLLQLQPLQKCFPRLGPGVGDKTLLRMCGYSLGLRETAWRSKKALQFGSRVANSQQNANDVSEFLS